MLGNALGEDMENYLSKLLSFKLEYLESGFKYLGYFLNPNNYKIVD